jgi:hypothetical protein
MKAKIRNISTKDILFQLAKVNLAGFPFVDLEFDTLKKLISITPISQDEREKRTLPEDREGTSVEDAINDI